MKLLSDFLNLFNKKLVSDDFVDTVIGKVYFFELTHGIENKVRAKATVIDNKINNSLYFKFMEQELVNLSKRKLYNLPITDGNKVREKLKEILLRNDVINKDETKEDNNNQFTHQETKWFDKAKRKTLDRFKQNARN